MVVNGEIRLDGISVRVSLKGQIILSYPGKRDVHGERHSFVRPVNDEVRREIERRVIVALPFLAEMNT